MKNWQQILKYALLGTERMPLDPTILPVEIQNRLNKIAADNPETKLLQAVALTWNFDRVGATPKPIDHLQIDPAPPETLKIAPPQYNDIFYRILRLNVQKNEALEVFFDTLIARNLVVSPTILYDFLELLTIKISATQKIPFHQKIWQVAGERGRWLAQFNQKWQTATLDETEDWEAATPARRSQIFQNWTHTQPQKALDQLDQNWELETPKIQKEWLYAIQNMPNSTQILAKNQAIFEKIYQKIQEKGDFKKEPVRAQITILRQILLQNPNAALFQFVVDELKKYVKQDRKMLGLLTQQIIDLPKTADNFFEPNLMEFRLGLPPKSTVAEWTNAELWTYNLVNDLHPQAWEAILGDDWAAIHKTIAQLAKRTPTDNALQLALIAALSRHRYERGIRPFLAKNEILTDEYPLLQILTNSELENYGLRIDFSNPSQPRNVFLRPDFRWSRTLSERVLRGVLDLRTEPYQHVDFALAAFRNFDLSLIPDLHYVLQNPSPSWREQQRNQQLVKPLIQLLEIREAITLV